MTDNKKLSFKEMLQASFKSEDTEEWLDVHFTRPIGLVFALMWKKFGVHPNVITVIGIVLGVIAGYFFYFDDMTSTLVAIVLMMFSNFCDSTDGQLARLTNQRTLLGRVLDGFSADVVFFCVYLALALRLMPEYIPGTDMQWGWWSFVLCAMAGFMGHSPQCLLSDYYRQIHLFFLKGVEGSELDDYASQRKIYEELPKSRWFARLYYYNYANYCRNQEKRTPRFQAMKKAMREMQEKGIAINDEMRKEFLAGSRPLMPFTNLLTFNLRAICLYIFCLLGLPWIYLLIEIVIMNLMLVYMHRSHEALCAKMKEKYLTV